MSLGIAEDIFVLSLSEQSLAAREVRAEAGKSEREIQNSFPQMY